MQCQLLIEPLNFFLQLVFTLLCVLKGLFCLQKPIYNFGKLQLKVSYRDLIIYILQFFRYCEGLRDNSNASKDIHYAIISCARARALRARSSIAAMRTATPIST